MKKLLLTLWLGLVSWPVLASPVVTYIGNANYSALPSDTYIAPTVALTANRTITLGYVAGETIPGSLQIADPLGNIGGSNSCLIIAPQSGDLINNSSASITFCATKGRIVLTPVSGTNWLLEIYGPGQVSATTTNDNAQAGYLGEIISSGICPGPASTATVTITIAAPGVFTDTAHGFTGACPVVFTNSGGGLPTGITSGTTYWVVPSTITTNTYSVATSVANALAGTAVTTTGTSTGTQTRTSGSTLTTNTAANITGIALTPGDWDCRATVSRTLGASTSVTKLQAAINATTATISAQGTDSATYFSTAANVLGATGIDSKIGPTRISVATLTNEFLAADDTFTVSTDIGFGIFTCRRPR